MVAATPSMFELILILFFQGGLIAPFGVPPLEEDAAILKAVPRESIAFVEWFGLGKASAKTENSTERLAANPEINEFARALEQALKKAAMQEPPREVRPFIESGIEFLEILVSRPGCVFVSGIDLPPKQPSVRAGLIVNVEGKAAEASRFLEQVERYLGREVGRDAPAEAREKTETPEGAFRPLPLPPMAPPVAWGVSGKYLIVGVGEGLPEKIAKALEAPGGSGPDKALQDLLSKVRVERPTLRAYVNVAQIMEMAVSAGGPQVSAFFNALGLSGITAVVSESGLEGKGFSTKTLMATTGTPRGLLRLAEGPPLSDEELGLIPRDATMASAFRCNPEAVYEEFLSVLGELDPRAKEEFLRQVPRALDRELGIDLLDDLIKPLGDAWCLWSAPSQGGLLVTGLTLAVPVKDHDRFAKTLDTIMNVARREMDADGRREGRRPQGIFIESLDYRGKKIHFVNAVGEEVPVAPAWCLTDRHLLVSLFPQTLKATISRGISVENSLARHPALQDRKGALAVSFVDAREFARTLYPVLLPLAQMACSKLQHEGIDIDIGKIPSAPAILPHLSQEVTTVERTEKGILLKTTGTLPTLGPLAGLLIPGAAVPLFVLRTSTAPSQADSQAERMHAMAELRRLHVALVAYRADTGKYPETLEALWTGETKYLQGPLEDPWGGSFVYYGGKEGREVMAERSAFRAAFPGDPRVVLYGDGSVGVVSDEGVLQVGGSEPGKRASPPKVEARKPAPKPVAPPPSVAPKAPATKTKSREPF